MIKLFSQVVNFFKQKKIIRAIQEKNAVEVARFLKTGISCSGIFGSSPLTVAILTQNIEIVKILLEHKAPVNQLAKNGSAPLETAVSIQCLPTVKLLLEFGASVDIMGNNPKTSPLVALATSRVYTSKAHNRENNLSILRLLLDAKINVNTQTEFADYPILLAAQEHDIELMQLLLEYGANITHVYNYSVYSPIVINFAIKYSKLNNIEVPLDILEAFEGTE